jgi:hypothetical protein
MAVTVADQKIVGIIQDPLAAALGLSETITDHAAAGEKVGRLAQPLHDALLEAGLFRMLMPKA